MDKLYKNSVTYEEDIYIIYFNYGYNIRPYGYWRSIKLLYVNNFKKSCKIYDKSGVAIKYK